MHDIRKRWKKLRKSSSQVNTSLRIIISAVLLLELMTGIMFYAAQNFIQRTMERMVGVEMNAVYLCIRNQLAKAEVTIDNMSWVVSESLDEPNWMFDLTRHILKNNPIFGGSGIAFVPGYYATKDRLYQPYSARRSKDSIVSLQVGRGLVDYTEREYYRVPLSTGESHWSEPYVDNVGVRGVTTTYSAPIRDAKNRIVGVILADIPISLMEDIVDDARIYPSTQRYLVSDHFKIMVGKKTPLAKDVLNIVKTDRHKSGYFVHSEKDGGKYHVFYTRVGGKTDWILMNILSDSDVFGRLRMMRLMLMLPVVLGLIFAWLIVWRSSKNAQHLQKVNAEKERIDGELRVASQIQQSLLPQGELSVDGLELEGLLKPAREVGGDLYDYFIRDEKLFFCIGDVSGKGAPSAILMAVVHALFRSVADHESNPARIMQFINAASCHNNNTNMFVTVFIGVLDLPTGLLRYCDAGHDAPFMLHDATPSLLDVNPHLPIGVFDDTKYDVQTITLHPNSTLFLYTDGLTEAMDAKHHLFGVERAKTVLEGVVNDSPQTILGKIVEEVEAYAKGAEQSDDLTLLAIRYVPVQFESTLNRTLTIKNDVREVAQFSTFIKALMEEMGIETSLARQIRLAVEEAVVNVIDYAYPVGKEGDVTIHIMSDGKTLHTQIVDTGVAFDPTAMQKADTSLSAEDRKIGGLGILLVREQMDSINYERTDGKNVLTLIKKLS